MGTKVTAEYLIELFDQQNPKGVKDYQNTRTRPRFIRIYLREEWPEIRNIMKYKRVGPPTTNTGTAYNFVKTMLEWLIRVCNPTGKVITLHEPKGKFRARTDLGLTILERYNYNLDGIIVDAWREIPTPKGTKINEFYQSLPM